MLNSSSLTPRHSPRIPSLKKKHKNQSAAAVNKTHVISKFTKIMKDHEKVFDKQRTWLWFKAKSSAVWEHVWDHGSSLCRQFLKWFLTNRTGLIFVCSHHASSFKLPVKRIQKWRLQALLALQGTTENFLRIFNCEYHKLHDWKIPPSPPYLTWENQELIYMIWSSQSLRNWLSEIQPSDRYKVKKLSCEKLIQEII